MADGTLSQLLDLIFTLNVQNGQQTERIKELEGRVEALTPKDAKKPAEPAPPS